MVQILQYMYHAMYMYASTQCMPLHVPCHMCVNACMHDVSTYAFTGQAKTVHIHWCLQKKLAVPINPKDVEQADTSSSDNTTSTSTYNSIKPLDTDSEPSPVPFNYALKPANMDLDQAQMHDDYASAPTVLQTPSTPIYSQSPPLQSSRGPRQLPISPIEPRRTFLSSQEIRDPPAPANPLPPIQAPGVPPSVTGPLHPAQISWHPSTFAPAGPPHQQAPSSADLAEQAEEEPARLVHAAIIDPDQIQICKRPNGHDWVLGAGSFGKVNCVHICLIPNWAICFCVARCCVKFSRKTATLKDCYSYSSRSGFSFVKLVVGVTLCTEQQNSAAYPLLVATHHAAGLQSQNG